MLPAQIMPLCFALWADNNIVKTLSNYHSPIILPDGSGVLKKKKKGSDGKRDFCRSEVPCPEQNREYSETFHLIDKGNGAEATYDMGGTSRTHNWGPKLVMRMVNMSMNNAYKIYDALVTEHTPDRRFLEMREAIEEMTHAFCQRGVSMRLQRAEHPWHSRDLTNVFESGVGRKVRSDAQGTIARSGPKLQSILKKIYALVNRQKKARWHRHRSLAYHKYGKCAWEGCVGLKKSKAKRPRNYDTYMRCDECSALRGKDMFFSVTTQRRVSQFFVTLPITINITTENTIQPRARNK
mmetsp:Transcript_29715/g.54805  ORF Transcript_29715/g.54805 Transcript_29715/m.54805 type:complete len:295 (+) Transcript_29715:1717-2601(+)